VVMDFIWFFLSGLFTGIANVIPGISGGTVLLIMGVYEKLIGIISGFKFSKRNPSMQKFRNRTQFTKSTVSFYFLFFLGLGALLGVAATAKIMSFLIENFSVPTYCFLIGIIVGSLKVITSKVNFKKVNTIIGIITGFSLLLVLFLLFSSSKQASSDSAILAELPGTMSFSESISLIFAGFFGAVAMVFPGISGSMLLVVLGLYEKVIDSISSFLILQILLIGIGVIIGIFLSAKIIQLLLKKAKNFLYSFLFGLVVSSLYTVWPIKEFVPDFATVLFSAVFLISGFFAGRYFIKFEKKYSPSF